MVGPVSRSSPDEMVSSGGACPAQSHTAVQLDCLVRGCNWQLSVSDPEDGVPVLDCHIRPTLELRHGGPEGLVENIHRQLRPADRRPGQRLVGLGSTELASLNQPLRGVPVSYTHLTLPTSDLV